MKLCAACNQELAKGHFSKKQWQLKQYRRCKSCIAVNREVNLEAPDNSPSLSGTGVVGMMEKCAISSEAGEPCHRDEDLFRQPPPKEECPVCFADLPINPNGIQYQACCGKILCMGCIVAAYKADDRHLCPFCRTPAVTGGDMLERIKKRAKGDHAVAICQLGSYYHQGSRGLSQNYVKALELYLRAGELGYAMAYGNIGSAYYLGEGVERDIEKAKHYYELAAMGGHVKARFNLGVLEKNAGNMSRAVKHWMIAAGAGYDKSLKGIHQLFTKGHVTKEDFEKALRAHKDAKDEMSSEQRDAAAAYLRSIGVIG